MNAPSLAAALQRISSDRQRTLVHQRMFLVWSALAIGLIVYILGSRAFGWNSPFFVPACVLIGVGAWFAVRASVARVKIDLLDIAREVESGDARLNSLLLAAYEEQNNAGPEGLSYIQERVILEALEANRRSPWGQQVAEKRYFKGVYHAIGAGAFVLIAGMAVLVGPRGSALGLLLGGIEVTPGTAQIEKGTALAVMAKFPEPAPNEVKLVIVPKTGPIRTVAMDRALQDPVFGASFPEVTEDFAYTVEYRGRKTAEYQVSVFEYPTLRRADAKLTYPEFTGLGEKKIDDTRRVSAVEGTVVDYRLELNKPVKNATLTTKTGQSIPLTKDAKFDNVYHLKIDLAESLKLSLALKDEAGRTNKLIQELALEALPNREPDLKIVFPRGDQRVSAIEEVSLQAEIRDDFGLGEYGLAYSLGGEAPKYIKVGAKASANEKKALAHLLRVEEMGAQTDQLVSYFAWAEDRGPDGKIRRSESDMYFAEIRPFEEIFRKGPDQPQQQQQEGQQGGPQSPGEQLAELQKNIINATWKLQRTERGPKPSPKFKEDVTIVRDSQKKALSQAETLIEKMTDPRTKALGEAAATEMRKAVDQLGEAASSKSVAPLPGALGAERAAYQALLRLQAKEYAVSRQRNQQGGGGGAQQRAQRALDELDIPEEKNRYETQSQAASPKNAAQQEQMQTLNRLKELSRRQSDINEKLQELQAALQEAKTDAEKEELLRRLKRLREEQQDAVQDMDDLQQKMAQSQNNPAEMADARQQLEKAREQAQKASEQMSEKSLGQANAAGARTEKDLKKLTEDFRKATAQQFNDEMRDMRRDARDLSEKQKEIAEKMEELKNPKQRTLSDAGGKDELARQLSQQKTNYANILERMKKVSEEAESNEPLLSQKLYDTVRDLNQKDTAPTLDKASEFLKRSFVPQASQLEQKARQDIEQLKRGVDEAAGRLLGDETDALRTAARELDELTRRVRNEAPGARGTNATSQTAAGPGGRDTNSVAGFSTNRVSTNQMAGLGSDARPGQTNSLNRGNGEGQSDRLAQNLRERTRGNRPGQPGERGQGSRQQESQPAAESPEGQAQNQGQNQGPGQGQQRGESQQAGAGENPRFFERAAAGQNNNQAGSGAQSGQEGPFTGGDFRNWADRLRDVQEMIDEPDLRNDVAQILDRARNVRSEFLRHAKTPEWNAVDQNIVKPLTEVRQRIAEELARRDSSTVAPLDRDPVPARYGELVSRYYQSLGQGAPGEKKPPTTLAPR